METIDLGLLYPSLPIGITVPAHLITNNIKSSFHVPPWSPELRS